MATRITGGAAPRLDSQGLITGYTNSKSGSAQRPLYDANGLIGGYSASSDIASPTTTVNASDPTGKYAFDAATGLNKQGLTRGQQAAKDYQASTQTVTNVKSPEIAAATSDALKQEQGLSSGIIKSFSDYLNEAKQLQQQSKDQVTQDTQTLNNAPAKLQSGLSDVVKNFAGTTSALDQKATDLNAANAKTVQDNIDRLNTLNTDYEAAARGVADRSLGNALARNNLYQSSSGTPTSNGGYWNTLAARTTADVLLPVEQQISQNRISQLTNYITPQQRQLYADRMSQITGLEMPVANALVQIGLTNANQVAQLQSSLAGRSLSEQIQYLSSLGLPIDAAQRVAQTLPQAIGALSNIDLANNFYGLAQDYENPLPTGLPTYNLPSPVANRSVYPVASGYQPLPSTVNPVTSYVNAAPAPSTPYTPPPVRYANPSVPWWNQPDQNVPDAAGYVGSAFKSYDYGYGYTPGGAAINPDMANVPYFSE